MIKGIVTPKEYPAILLTGVLEKGAIVERIKRLHLTGQSDIIPGVLLIGNSTHSGYLVADGNHRLTTFSEFRDLAEQAFIECGEKNLQQYVRDWKRTRSVSGS